MSRRFYSTLLTCLCLLLVANIARGDDTPQEGETAASLIERVKENPDDVKLLNEYFSAEFGKIVPHLSSDPDAALKGADELEAALEGIEPTDAQAKALINRARTSINYIRERIEIDRLSMDEVVAKLKENPADGKTLGVFRSKVMSEVSSIARSEPIEAEQKINDAKALLAELSEKIDDEEVKKTYDQTAKSLASLDRTIASAKRLLELVGKDAAPLNVEAWVNGDPLSDADLKGKVVMLDFWAVWCGPCIATFPHLREWQETYADKGLVIVGLTSYYNYAWDEEANRATRSKEEVTPEQEQEMLAKFAKEHDLHHRFAITKGRELSEYYAVSGIPHVVVIDQEGKVRMIRVGSGPKNAKDIDELLAELLK